MNRIPAPYLAAFIFPMLCMVATHACAQSATTSDDAAAKLASQVCSSCHGPGGNSKSPTFPKLAAQQQPYLAVQIQAFKSGARGEQEAHDYMLGMATLIDADTAAALARYFARQAPPQGTAGDPAQMAAGQKLFTQGIAGRVAPCASCHGDRAQGNGIFPRLAGQHAAYLVRQLKVIQGNLRNSPVMHGIIKDLKPEEMKEVAVYLQSI